MNGDGNLLFLRSKSYKGHTSYGQGFYISDDWINNLFGIKLISNRISIIQFYLDEREQSNLLTIINVYAPTSFITERNLVETEELYQTLKETYS